MSIFRGHLQGIPDVAVDDFTDDNLGATAFFLSHAHTDHMRGLDHPHFYERLRAAEDEGQDVYLYCSEITRLYLMNMSYKRLDKYIRILELGPSSLKFPSSEDPCVTRTLTVTCMPAGHCPGSIMLLFEMDQHTVLYTGDFRILPEDITKFSPLSDGEFVKRIDTVYLDTTFLDKSYYYFPSRAQSAAIVCDKIREWIQLSSDHVVVLDLPAHCGSEHIFARIRVALGIQVHVKRSKYKQYRGIEEIRMSLTDSPHSRVHACCHPNDAAGKTLPCLGDGYHIRIIKPSAMWFKSTGADRKPLFKISHDGYYCKVAQSQHASFKELADIMSLLKASKIIPIAIPPSRRRRDVLKLMHELITNVNSENFQQEDGNQTDSDVSSDTEFVLQRDSIEKQIYQSLVN